MKEEKASSEWKTKETVGEWLSRKLEEAFRKLPSDVKITNPIQWLAETSNINIATIYRLKKSENYYISRDSIRERLAYKKNRDGTESKILGYYGYPPTKNNTEQEMEKITRKKILDIEEIFENLNVCYGDIPCQLCNPSENELVSPEHTWSDKTFVNEYAQAKRSVIKTDEKTIFYLYISSQSNRYFGAISKELEREHFEVPLYICRNCFHENKKYFIMPISSIIHVIQEKYSLDLTTVAKDLGVDKSTVYMLLNDNIFFVKKSLIAKIFSLLFYGTTAADVSPAARVYAMSIRQVVNNFLLKSARLDCSVDLGKELCKELGLETPEVIDKLLNKEKSKVIEKHKYLAVQFIHAYCWSYSFDENKIEMDVTINYFALHRLHKELILFKQRFNLTLCDKSRGIVYNLEIAGFNNIVCFFTQEIASLQLLVDTKDINLEFYRDQLK